MKNGFPWSMVQAALGICCLASPLAQASGTRDAAFWMAPRSAWESRLPPRDPCAAVSQGVDTLLADLGSQTHPAARFLAAFDGTFGFLSQRCHLGAWKYAAWRLSLQRIPNPVAQRLRSPAYLVRQLPEALAAPGISAPQVMLWAFPQMEKEARTACRESGKCPVSELVGDLSSQWTWEPNPELLARSEALLDSARTVSMPAPVAEFLAWSRSSRLRAQLGGRLTARLVGALAPHAHLAVRMLPARMEGDCPSEAKIWQEHFEAESGSAQRPEVLAWAARRLGAVCGNQKIPAEVRRGLEGRVKIPSELSRMTISSPEEAVEAVYQEDVALRNSLSLAFFTSPQENLAELRAGTTDAGTMARDAILVAHLRAQGEALPWMSIDGIIELVEEQHALEAHIVESLRSQGPGARFLALSLLLTQGNGDTSQHVVNAIRQLSTELASSWLPMRDLAWRIHNNLELALVSRVQALRSRPDAGPHEEKLMALLALLDRFFGRHDDLPRHLQSLARWRPQDAAEFALALEEPEPARRLANAIGVGNRLVALADNEDATPDLHSESLRSLLALQGEIQRLLGMVKPTDLSSAQRQALLAYAARLAGFAASGPFDGKTLVTLTQKIQGLFHARSELLEWFLLAQRSRQGAPETYVRSVALRSAALTGATEKLIRDLGFHLLAPFAEQASDTLRERPMNPGVAVGTLVFVPKEDLERHAYRPDEILVTDGIPLNLGVTAGLVTEVFQPLASHIDLRTRERGTPNAFVATARERWKELFGKRVKLTVGTREISIEAFTGEAPRPQGKPRSHVVPAFDGTQMASIDLDGHEITIGQVGAKAWGYAALRQLFKGSATTPKALAIPFGLYVQAARNASVAPLVADLLRLRKRLSPTETEARLENIQKALRAVAESPAFAASESYARLLGDLNLLATQTQEEGLAAGWDLGQRCFRFRSSTNSEDLVAFTGAGLYDSATGCLAPAGDRKKQTPARALGKVWASLWTYRAFMEREHMGIDHARVAMAVLVHRHWDDETANGVLITTSASDNLSLVSVQPGEDLVTNPSGEPLGDEILARLGSSEPLRARYSDAAHPLLTSDELSALLEAGEKVRRHFTPLFAGQTETAALRFDVEFKFVPWNDGKRHLIVKQARPYLGGI